MYLHSVVKLKLPVMVRMSGLDLLKRMMWELKKNGLQI